MAPKNNKSFELKTCGFLWNIEKFQKMQEHILRTRFYSANHKNINLVYFLVALFSASTATTFSIFIRMELSNPGSRFFTTNYQLYNVSVTLHALIMIFFFGMPCLTGGFGNFFLPLMLGSPDMSFSQINNFSLWLLVPAMFFLSLSAFVKTGADTGWTMYPPLSSTAAQKS